MILRNMPQLRDMGVSGFKGGRYEGHLGHLREPRGITKELGDSPQTLTWRFTGLSK